MGPRHVTKLGWYSALRSATFLARCFLIRQLTLLFFTFLLFSACLAAQTVAQAKGVAHTPEVDIAYETLGTTGSGLAVIAINGGPGLTHAYMVQNDLWERIAQRRLVVFYDQRGTGASKPRGGGRLSQTMGAQVADLEAVRQALKLEKVALVGDSYGGLVAMAYAAAHPQHVAKLVLSDSPGPSWKEMVHLLPQVFPDVEERGKQEAQKAGDSVPPAQRADAEARAGLRNHFRMIFYSPEKRDAYMSRMGELGFEPAVNEAVSNATAGLDLTQKLAAFNFPTLVITGRFDLNVAPLTAWRLAHAIPGAKIVFLEHSGHLPSYEEPERYVEVVEGFLEGK
jgi:proline iminopeptidase